MGKVLVGIEVSHNLNYLCVFYPNYSTTFYSYDIHDAAKWQFCSKIHVPFNSPDLTSYWAFGPCPWPSEMDYDFLSIYFANLVKSVTGSEPADKRNINGVKLLESL